MEISVVLLFFISVAALDFIPLWKERDKKLNVFYTLVLLAGLTFVSMRSLRFDMPFIYPNLKALMLFIVDSLTGKGG